MSTAPVKPRPAPVAQSELELAEYGLERILQGADLSHLARWQIHLEVALGHFLEAGVHRGERPGEPAEKENAQPQTQGQAYDPSRKIGLNSAKSQNFFGQSKATKGQGWQGEAQEQRSGVDGRS